MWRISLLVVPSLAALALFGPQYDPDLFYYTSGATNWEPGRPPLYTFFLSVCRRLWASPYFPALLQIAFWAAAVRSLLDAAFSDERSKNVATLILAWEPVGMYYRVSLLSEGLFEAALIFQTAFLIRGRHGAAGAAAGLALLTRYSAVFCAPMWLWAAFSPKPRPQPAEKQLLEVAKRPAYFLDTRYFVLLGPIIALILVVSGHRLLSGGTTGPGAFLAFHARPQIPECPVPEGLPRQEVVRRQALCLAQTFAQFPPGVAKVKADSVLLRRSLTMGASAWAGVYIRHARDNLVAAISQNRLDYRNDEIRYLEQDYVELDELAFRLYGLKRDAPEFWTRPLFWNVYMTLILIFLGITARKGLKNQGRDKYLLALSAFLPLLLLILGPVPYKTRFVAPWLGLAWVWMVSVWRRGA